MEVCDFGCEGSHNVLEAVPGGALCEYVSEDIECEWVDSVSIEAMMGIDK